MPDYVPTEGLVAWYPFIGNAYDQSGNDLNGSVNGAVLTADRYGLGENAYYFGGDFPQFIALPELDANLGQVGSQTSISLWFKPENNPVTGSGQLIHASHEGYPEIFARIEATQLESVKIYHRNAFTNNEPIGGIAPFGEWSFLCALIDQQSGSYNMWLNGEPLESIDFSFDASESYFSEGRSWEIGAISAAPNYHQFKGAIDDITIHNRILSETEIEGLYMSEAPSVGCTDPAACNYDVTAEDDDGSCLYPPSGNLGEAVALCHDGGTLDAGPGFSNYAWSTGADTQMIDVFEEGEYSVTTTFGGAPPNASSVELEGTGGALESAIQTTDSLTDATWMGWFWFDDLDAPQGLLAQNNGYNTNGYYINTNPFFDTAMSTGGSSNSAIWFSSPVGSTNQNAQSWTQADAILPMTWHHIAVVLENGLIHIHVDGIAATMHNSFNEDWLALYDVDQHVVEASDAPFRLGSGTDINGNVDQVMRGKMDGISLWNRALTQDEIQGYMNCPPSSGSAGIQALWTFEDPSPLEDQSGQGHNATLASGQIVSEAPVSICPSCTTQDTALVVHMECEGLCGDGTVWDSSLGTCVSICEDPQGQCGEGTVWDPINEECIVAIPADLNYDGCVTVNDLLELLIVHGTCPPYPEWPDELVDTAWACGDPLTYWNYDYATVLIGDQCWFAENCRHLPSVSAPSNLGTTELDTLPRAFVYGHSNTTLSEAVATMEYATYGAMYNWAAIELWAICPNGWHLPSDSDWQSLESNMGMTALELNDIGWQRGYEDALGIVLQTNGFQINSVGGFVHHTLGFLGANEQAFYWSSTLDDSNPSIPGPIFHRRFSSSQDGIYRGSDFNQNSGAYIRCMED